MDFIDQRHGHFQNNRYTDYRILNCQISNFAMVNRSWPTAATGEADSVSSVSASVCHIAGPNSVDPGQFLLVHGNNYP